MRIFIDGFESGGSDLWDQVYGGSLDGTTKKTGTYSFFANNTAYRAKSLASAIGTIYFKFYFYFTGSSGFNNPVFSVSNTSGYQVTLYFNNPSRTFCFKLGGDTGSVLGGLYSPALGVSTWHLVEGKITIDNASGVAQLKLNGNAGLDIDFSGDTQYQSTGQITTVTLGNWTMGSSYYYVDDFVLDDASWIGNTRIQGLVPTGAGNSAQWTPSTGSNYACVDEVPPNDADYVTTNSNDQVDTYATGNLTGAIAEVKCVQVQARAVKEGTPTPTKLALVVRSGGADYASADQAVQTYFKSLSTIWETNPNTSAAWSTSEVDAMEIGIKSRA